MSTPAAEMDDDQLSFQLRWKLLVFGLVGIGLVHVGAWTLVDGQTYKVMFAWGTTLGALSFALLWWTLVCGLAWSTRLRGLAALALLIGLAASIIRIDRIDYYGDMIPIVHWSFRWEKSYAEKKTDYFDSEPLATLPARPKQAEAPTGNPTQAVTPDEANPGPETPKSAPTTIESGDAKHKPPSWQPGDWPEFRGPRRDGIAVGESIRTDWAANPPTQVWRHPVGAGWSSFAVVGERIYTQEQRENDECVVCYQASSGARVWIHQDETLFDESMGGVGPRATPTVHAGRVYSLGATGILNCLDAFTGARVWSRDILGEIGRANLKWAMAGSPLIVDDVVIVSPNGGLAAFDKKTGKAVWTNKRQDGSYSSPVVETIAGQRQVLLFGGLGVAGYDIQSGAELWKSIEWKNGPRINVALPIVRDERWVFIGTDYGTGSLLLDVQHDGSKWTAGVEKELPNQFRLKFNDAIYKDEMLYGADDGILSCIDYKTGKRQWKRGRYGYGQLLLINDMLLVQAESGEVVLVEATPDEFREVTRFQAIEGKTWNHPVVSRGRLFVRNAAEAACYDISSGDN